MKNRPQSNIKKKNTRKALIEKFRNDVNVQAAAAQVLASSSAPAPSVQVTQTPAQTPSIQATPAQVPTTSVQAPRTIRVIAQNYNAFSTRLPTGQLICPQNRSSEQRVRARLGG